MSIRTPITYLLVALLTIGTLSGCASTQVRFSPAPPERICNPAQSALVLWSTQWRPDQKDSAAREQAAGQGLASFLNTSGCFARTQQQRITSGQGESPGPEWSATRSRFDTTVMVTVRELGPVLKVGSAALVEGGTEVVLDIAIFDRASTAASRRFTVHWQNGGAGVIKGVASLPADMAAALAAALQKQP